MNDTSPAELIRGYLRTALRQWKKLLLFNLVVIAGVAALLLYCPRTYRSEAKIWIKLGRENSKLDPTASTGETISIQENDREDDIQSVIDIIGGRGVASAAVESLGADVILGDAPPPGTESDESETPNALVQSIQSGIGSVIGLIKSIDPVSEREEAIQEVLESVSVDAERKSNVVSLRYDSKDPALSQALVQEIIDQYQTNHSLIHQTVGSLGFFRQQHAELQAKVAQAAGELRDVKDGYGIASIAGQRSILEAEMLNVRQAALETRRQATQAEAQVAEFQRQIGFHPETIQSEEKSIPNTGRDALQAQLYALQVERMNLESKQAPNHPQLMRVIRQEEQAKAELESGFAEERNETTSSINQVRRSLSLSLAQVETQLAGHQSTLKALETQQEQITARIRELNQADIEVKRLERELAMAEQNYTLYSDSLEEARLDEALDESAISNISVAQEPTFQEKPVSPSKLLLLLFGVASTVAGSLAIIAGAQWMDQSLDQPPGEPDPAESPVVVTVPEDLRYREALH